jgi:cyclopropane fatty-acyl-phospholipid synthase-like methyltransferase
MKNYPRTSKYDPMWIINNEMGPNPILLAEFLTQPFDLKPGNRVLDLGCGKGITSVFLAREYGVQVYSVDFDAWEGWTSPEERWNNAIISDVQNLVIPITADARKLPFAKGFFDVIICIDSYFYFGKDDTFLPYILQFLNPGGKIGIIIPGYMKDPEGNVPTHIKAFLGDELWTWETLDWWKTLWEQSGLVTIDVADTMPDGWLFWQRFDEARLAVGKNDTPDEIEYFKTDKGEYIGFIRLIATKN